MKLALAIALVAVVGCKDKAPAPAASGSAPVLVAPKVAKAGSIAPIITNSVTFVTPKNAKWWGETNFACYRAVMGMSGKSPGEAFENISPLVKPAMTAAGVDLGHDLAAIGGFECGDSPCFYVAAHLSAPQKMKDALAILAPQAPVKEVEPGHYVIETPGVSGARVMHIRVVPLDWTTKAGSDAFSQQVSAATHVVFIIGADDKNVEIDPLPLLSDGAAAKSKVADVESVLASSNDRCIIADIAQREFQPGFTLKRGRIALAVPEAGGTKDAVMRLLDSSKTLDLEADLALSPAPKEADAQGWIAMGESALAGVAANLKQTFAGQGELMNGYIDMIALVARKGFQHEISNDALRLSWRTNRIPESELTKIGQQLERLVAP